MVEMRASTLLLVCLALCAAVNCYSFTATGTVQVGTGAAWPATIKANDVSNKVQIDYEFGVTELELYDQQSRFQTCPSSCKNYFLSNPLPVFNFANIGNVQNLGNGNMKYTSPSENGYVTTVWTSGGVPNKVTQVGDGYSRTYVFSSFILNNPTFSPTPNNCQQVQCGQALDLMLVIDSSGSISPSDYVIEMDYAQQVIDSFTIGPYGVRAGFVTFSSYAALRSTLTGDKAVLDAVISGTAQQQGETNIGAAINMAAAEFQSPRARGGSVPKVIILLTDGKANRPPENPISFMITAANSAKADGILIYAIGVGSLVQQSDLNDIASAPAADYTSLVSNFAALQSTISNILRQVCVGGETDGCNPSCNVETEFCGCGSCLCVGSDELSCGERGVWNQANCECDCAANWDQSGNGRTCTKCTITGCQNGGTLISNVATDQCRCACKTNYIGNVCETCNFDCPGVPVVDSCSAGTCRCPSGSHATLASGCLTCRSDYCVNGVSKPGCLGCQCPTQYWHGDDCSECNWVCSHGGTHINCADCSCVDPWDGDHCQNCKRTCKNGGVLDTTTCTCSCDPQYSGVECENCNSGYCKRGGTLTATCGCNCPASIYWGGDDCNECVVNCGAGTRDTSNGQCKCNCPPHLTGATCNQCKTDYCKNGAFQGIFANDGCDDCLCAGNWVGDKCDDCKLNNNGATPKCLSGTPNTACTACICPTFKSNNVDIAKTDGTYCDTCNELMCVNGVINEGTFPDCRCTCPPGFEGRRCDTCISDLCSNDGEPTDNTCKSCNCPSDKNWSGKFCDECNLVCLNGGELNTATCECDCAGFWRGNTCELCDFGDEAPFCDECSYNGVLNEDCTKCECDEYHTGEICDICKYNCGLNGERSEDCKTCICEYGWLAATNCTVCDTTLNSVYCNGRGIITNAAEGCNICNCENFWGLDDCSECVIDCNGNGAGNDDCTACVCENSWKETDNCLTCDLTCANGVHNEECTACVCEGGYTGRLCDECDAINYIEKCIYAGETLTADCECDCIDQWTGRYCNECDLSALNCENGDIINSVINGEPQCRCRCYSNWIGDQCNICGFLDEGNPLYQCPDISIPVLTDCSCHCPEYYRDIEGCTECIITNEDCVHVDPNSVPDLRKGECKCICLGNWSGRTCNTCDPLKVICDEGYALDTTTCECKTVCGDGLIVGEEECEISKLDDIPIDSVCCRDCFFDEKRPCNDLRTCTRFDFCEVKGSKISCDGTDKLDYTVDTLRESIPLGPLTGNYWSNWGITVTSTVPVSIVDTRTLGYPSTNPCGGDIVFERVIVAPSNQQNAQLCFNMVEPVEVQSVSVINNSKEPGASNSFRIDFYCTDTIGPITVDARNYGPGSVEFIRNPCTGSLVTKICYRNFPNGAIGPVFFCDDNNSNLGRLGDYVWYDISVDNIQDANELPVPGVPVKLYEGTSNRYLAITYTNEQGLYIFEYLYNGNYSVEFNVPTGYTYSTPVRYPYDNNLHYGVLDKYFITDTVKEILIVDVGIYMFGGIGDYIFYDVSEDGLQNEAAAFSIGGVRLDLYHDDDINTIIATKYTDAVGNYLFYPLPVFKSATTYHSYLVKMTPPENSYVTLRYSGSDTRIDSNFDRTTYWSDVIPLTPQRPLDLTIDGGIYYCCGSVGDRVWIDSKIDGIQNDVERDNGVPDVRVTLYRNGVAVGSQRTDREGLYLFTELPLSGSYYVNFDKVPGYVLTEKSKGTDREQDSDANPNGDTDTFFLTRERPDRRDIDAGLKVGCTVASECSTDNRCLTAICNAANQCEYTDTVVCDRLSDPCVEPVCQPSTGLCLPVPIISAVNIPCDDNNVCTIGDICVGGQCKGTPRTGTAFVCNDNDVCTNGDHCIEGECKGTPCTENSDPCITTVCTATGCRDEFSSEGTPCNDNNLCTDRDVCDGSGRCGGTTRTCTNNEYCKEYTCDPGNGQCKARLVPDVPCSDGNPCTLDDTCDTSGRCLGTTLVCTGTNPCLNYSCLNGQCITTVKSSTTSCDDNDECTVGDKCQPDASCAGTPKNCDDRKVCTTDVCRAGTCVHTVATDATCPDSDPCTTEVCDAITGNCVSTPIVCDDSKPCTTDRCVNGQCVSTPTGDACDDNNLCTVYDICSADGTCKGTIKNCDDGNICTDDSCDPLIGCVHVDNNEPCVDGTECSTKSYCVAGQCIGYDLVQCTTSNPCSQIECDRSTGSCVESDKPDGTVCQTDDLCRLNGVCEDGECQGRETVCNDNNPCTVDSCVNGECVFTDTPDTDNVPCDDGNKCTIRDVCVYDDGFNLSRCRGTARDCDDGNICTIDFCNISTGECDIENHDSTVTCDDNDKCTKGDYCLEGECRGSDVLCPTAGVCKANECSPLTGACEESITEGARCNDGILCTDPDTCDANGNCVGQAICTSVHPNPCKMFICSENSVDGPRCEVVNRPELTICNDSDACTQTDVCILGVCTGTNPVECESDECNRGECVVEEGVAICRTTFTQAVCGESVGCNDYICSAGSCTPFVNRNCNAGNSNTCIERFCAADGTCAERNLDNIPCEDGDPCTESTCRGGECRQSGTIQPCGDCRADSDCTSVAPNCFHYECVNDECLLIPNTCTSFTNPCLVAECDIETGECKPRKLEGNRCNDNSRCTENDICVSTGPGDEEIDCVGTDIPCQNRECRVGTCNPLSGQCTYEGTPDAECDDGDDCTENDRCDPRANCNGTPKSCADGDVCTTDACVGGECRHTFNNLACDDGNACSSGDICIEGVCSGRTETTCPNSSDPCKRFVCDIIRGCIEEPVEDEVVCGEADDCYVGDSVCSGGVCVPSERVTCPDPIDPQCPSVCVNNICTVAESSCDDNDECTVQDRCRPNGQCAGAALDCSEFDNGCVEGVCFEGGCVERPIQGSTECDDGDLCTENVCEDGRCVSTPTVCSSNNPCERFTCDSRRGCVAENNPVSCTPVNQIANLCKDYICIDRACEEVDPENPCDDNNPCTEDRCFPLTGACEHPPRDGSCEVSDPCNIGTCIAGACTTTERVCPSDENECTDDICVGGVCYNIPAIRQCSYTSGCITGGMCNTNGECKPSTFSDCPTAIGECKKAECNKETGECEVTDVTDGTTVCNDADACTNPGVCTASGCFVTPITCADQPPIDCKEYFCEDGACKLRNNDNLNCSSIETPCISHHCVNGECVVDELSSNDCSDDDLCTYGNVCTDKGCESTPYSCILSPCIFSECNDDGLCVTEDYVDSWNPLTYIGFKTEVAANTSVTNFYLVAVSSLTGDIRGFARVSNRILSLQVKPYVGGLYVVLANQGRGSNLYQVPVNVSAVNVLADGVLAGWPLITGIGSTTNPLDDPDLSFRPTFVAVDRPHTYSLWASAKYTGKLYSLNTATNPAGQTLEYPSMLSDWQGYTWDNHGKVIYGANGRKLELANIAQYQPLPYEEGVNFLCDGNDVLPPGTLIDMFVRADETIVGATDDKESSQFNVFSVRFGTDENGVAKCFSTNQAIDKSAFVTRAAPEEILEVVAVAFDDTICAVAAGTPASNGGSNTGGGGSPGGVSHNGGGGSPGGPTIPPDEVVHYQGGSIPGAHTPGTTDNGVLTGGTGSIATAVVSVVGSSAVAAFAIFAVVLGLNNTKKDPPPNLTAALVGNEAAAIASDNPLFQGLAEAGNNVLA